MWVIAMPKDRDEAKDMFGIFYTTAFGGEGAKDHSAARKLSKLQDELEAISTEEDVPEDELPRGVKKDTRWVLNKSVKNIKLEDAHWSLLKSRIYGGGIAWSAGVNSKVLAAYDALAGAEEIMPAKKKKEK